MWRGVSRDLFDYVNKVGQDLVLTLSTEDFRINKQKKKNLIEIVGFIFERKGSTVIEPIILKSITVKLDTR